MPQSHSPSDERSPFVVSSSRSLSPSPPPADSSVGAETPHEAVSRRIPYIWTAADEKHRLSLLRQQHDDPRFNPPPPSAWKRFLLVLLCVGLVWWAFHARLGLWANKKTASREAMSRMRNVREQEVPVAIVEEQGIPIEQARGGLGGVKTRPTVVPSRDEI